MLTLVSGRGKFISSVFLRQFDVEKHFNLDSDQILDFSNLGYSILISSALKSTPSLLKIEGPKEYKCRL